MALITRIEEIQPFVAIGEGNYIESFGPAIDAVEQNEIIPAISQEQYDALQEVYGDGSQPVEDGDLKKLLVHVQRVISNLAVAESLDFRQVRLTENGLTRSESESSKTAFHYQKIEAQEYLFNKGFSAVENLLKFLEKNKDKYALWVDSEAYTLSGKHIIASAEDFQNFYNINRSRRTYQALMPIMARVEMLIVEERIGEAFLKELKDKQRSSSLQAEETRLMNRYLKNAIASFTISQAVNELGLELTPKGLQLTSRASNQDSNEEKKPAAPTQQQSISERTAGNANVYLQQAVGYLKEKASATVFKTFFDSELYPKQSVVRNSDTSKAIYNGL